MAEIVRESLPQAGELAVGVAVHVAKGPRDGIQDVVGHFGRNGVSVLVHVEGDGQRRLRRSVGSHAPEVVAKRKVVEAHGHLTHGRRRRAG